MHGRRPVRNLANFLNDNQSTSEPEWRHPQMERKFSETKLLQTRALKTIPLASQTFSKSAMNFVEGASPLFLDRGDGCRVWDVDGNEYLDFMLGLMPVVLGYRDPDVDDAIRRQLDKGITFSLATSLEFELAERLVEMIPCAEMVRYGKNGSDATSAAIRLARAFTRRDKVAHCGYHGWHDWYIGSTTRYLGVPDAIRNLSQTFAFNDAQALEKMLSEDPDGYAAVILEPAGTVDPEPGFLESLREITRRYGVILIFDEIVTGLRLSMGGAQEKYNVVPDLACFGKAMGNGMPISAIVGHRDIMILMEDIFYSGTFGGEALSLAASIATIDKMISSNGIERVNEVGAVLHRTISGILDKYGLDKRFAIAGPSWKPAIKVLGGGGQGTLELSLLRQELIANGILMGANFNICLAHDDAVLEETEMRWDKACEAVASAYNDPDPARHLRGNPIQPVFEVRKSS